jgi:uncharacterized protein YkwD
MRRPSFRTSILFITLLLMTVWAARVTLARDVDPVAIAQLEQVERQLQAALSVEPERLAPGETVTLTAILTNPAQSAVQAELHLPLPYTFSFPITRLPSGASFNAQENRLIWRVTLLPGESRHFTLPLEATSADSHNPHQTFTARVVSEQHSTEISAAAWIGEPPRVLLIAPREISVGQTVQLSADIHGPGPFTQRWDLGDGRIFQAEEPGVIYARSGIYQVSAIVANPAGETRASRFIAVVEEPAAWFLPDDATPAVGQPVRFDNLSGGLPPLRHEWDFGDGTTSDQPSPTHRYSLAGSWPVRLRVSNGLGSAETTIMLTIGEPPRADMQLDATGVMGQPLRGLATGDPSITRFTWDLGNGRTRHGAELGHVYTAPGDYLVTLTATNEYGDTRLAQMVRIEEGPLTVWLPLIMLDSGTDPDPQPLDSDPQSPIPNPQPAPAAAAPDPATVDPNLLRDSVPAEYGQAERMAWYINKSRMAAGLPVLLPDAGLRQAAQRHADDMARHGFGSHTGSDGSTPAMRQTVAGYIGAYAGEATAWGFRFPSDALRFWLESTSHRPLILNTLADQFGVAYAENPDTPSVYYWVVEFGSTTHPFPLPSSGIRPTPWPTRVPTPAAAPVAPVATPLPAAPVDPIVPVDPTATPVPIVVEQPTATPLPPTALPPAATATPQPVVEPTATPLPLPTETPQPTPTPLPEATPLPTATPHGIVIPTETAPTVPTLTPEPEGREGEGGQAAVPPAPTPKAYPTPLPTAGSPLGTPEVAVMRFFESLRVDPTGMVARNYATETLRQRITAHGILAVLESQAVPKNYAILGKTETAVESWLLVQLVLPDGSLLTRQFIATQNDGEWLINDITPPPG